MSQQEIESGLMDDLMDKLKLLNFEKLLLKGLKLKPPNRRYFEKPRNPGEQFFMFTSLCAWLARNLGKDFDQPQEFDDPSSTIAKIIRLLQDLVSIPLSLYIPPTDTPSSPLQEISTDFPSNKLIQGGGPICVFILDALATQVLKVSGIKFDSPVIQAEEEQPMEILENDAEVILEKVEEEQNAMPSEDDSDSGETPLNLNRNKKNFEGFSTTTRDPDDRDTDNWRLELERVLPQLKVVIRTDPRDWRAHLEQIKTLHKEIESARTETEPQLKKLETDIGFVMEKIESREKHLNNELKDYLAEYKTLSLELRKIETALNDSEQAKITAEEELSTILGDLDMTKGQMDQRGTSMADGSPLINIKKAIIRLKEELVQMDLKIGVLDHSFTQDNIRHNAQITEATPVSLL